MTSFISDNLKTPLEPLRHFQSDNYLFIKRDDKIHPIISGNKWRKLRLNIEAFRQSSHQQIITFGGAFSNHIAAVAAVGKLFDIPTVGVIRGEEEKALNSTLQRAKDDGMRLYFISRADYRHRNDPEFLVALIQSLGGGMLIPEGGTNDLAVEGCRDITDEIHAQLNGYPDYIAVSCGTGGTMAGIITAANPKTKVIGFSALKGDFLEEDVRNFLGKHNKSIVADWEITDAYCFGGYARWNMELIDFMNKFKRKYGVQLDPIYTGKMMFGLFDMMKKEIITPGATVVAVHTGGLQGIVGFNQRFGDLILQ